MNNNENIQEWISRYSDGDLTQKELRAFLKILESDQEVCAETELDRELTDFLQDRDLLEFLEVLDRVKYEKRGRFGLNCLLLAALLVILVTLGGFWIYMKPISIEHPMMGRGKLITIDSNPAISQKKERQFFWQSPGYPQILQESERKGQELLAANFQPLIYMEGMVGVVTRAGRFNLMSPESIVAPAPGDTIHFLWKQQEGTNLSFIVLNNRGENIVNRNNLTGGSLILVANEWQEGLYYWKFMLNDNLANVGKIIIKR